MKTLKYIDLSLTFDVCYGDMVVSDVVYDQLMKLYKSDYPETDWCEIADKYPELYDWLDSHITNIDDGYSFNYKLKFIE